MQNRPWTAFKQFQLSSSQICLSFTLIFKYRLKTHLRFSILITIWTWQWTLVMQRQTCKGKFAEKTHRYSGGGLREFHNKSASTKFNFLLNINNKGQTGSYLYTACKICAWNSINRLSFALRLMNAQLIMFLTGKVATFASVVYQKNHLRLWVEMKWNP